MNRRDIQASVGQRLLWLKHEYEGRSATLNCPVVCRVEGPLDRKALDAALACLIDRHESLRTNFIRRGRELRQVIHESSLAQSQFVDLTNSGNPQATVEELLKNELETGIDPSTSPVRISLWRLAPESHLLCINMHHLITDTWSCMVLQRELGVAYEHCQNGLVRLPPAGWQFSQFMAWQRRQIEGDGFQRHREYWRQHLAGASLPNLPFRPIKTRAIRERTSIRGAIDAQTTLKLRALAERNQTTLFAVALSVYYVLLNRLTGQLDLVVGTLFANRTRREVANTVGFLANLVALRTRLESTFRFTDVVDRVWTTVVNGISHQELPFHLASQGAFGSSSPRPDEMVFQMLSEGIDETYKAGSLDFHSLTPDVGGRFDLELALMPVNDGLGIRLHYAKDRLTADWATSFLSTYIAVATAVGDHPNQPLTDLEISSSQAATGVPL